MTTTVSPVQSDLFTAIRAFLLSIVPAGTPVVQGRNNRVPMPTVPYVLMTPVFQIRLTTNQDTYTDTFPTPGGTQEAEAAMRVDVQLDFYGPDSQAWATMTQTLWRDQVGCDALAPTCAPLYAEDPRMLPLVTGEEQFLERWMLTASLEYDPVTVTAQEFADTLEAELINVDERYPPT